MPGWRAGRSGAHGALEWSSRAAAATIPRSLSSSGSDGGTFVFRTDNDATRTTPAPAVVPQSSRHNNPAARPPLATTTLPRHDPSPRTNEQTNDRTTAAHPPVRQLVERDVVRHSVRVRIVRGALRDERDHLLVAHDVARARRRIARVRPDTRAADVVDAHVWQQVAVALAAYRALRRVATTINGGPTTRRRRRTAGWGPPA